MRLLVAALATVALSGCIFNLDKKTDAEGTATPKVAAVTFTDQGSVSGLQAFTTNVHPLVTANCASCHADEQSPKFAVGDPQQSYLTFINAGIVSFPAPATSRILTKKSDGHCGQTCTGDSSAWLAKISAWAAVECAQRGTCVSSAPTGSRLTTVAQTVPANLPTGTSFTTLTWALGDVNPKLTGASFMVDMQQYQGANSYLLRRPRLANPASVGFPIHVSNVQVAINGQTDPDATTYTVIDRVVAPTGTATLSQSSMILLKSKGPGADQISISFGVLEKAE